MPEVFIRQHRVDVTEWGIYVECVWIADGAKALNGRISIGRWGDGDRLIN